MEREKETNGKYQVGSGRIVTVTHDTPFVEDIVPQPDDSVNSKFSLSEKYSDEAYLSAVERGDMETAQRMVDEAADREILAMALEGAVQSEESFGCICYSVE